MKTDHIGRVRSIEIETIKLAAAERADDLARKHGLPFLAEFLSNISARLTPASEAGGRRYQQEIVERGELEVFSPYTGETARSTVSFLVLRSIFYRFPGPPEFYVAASRTALGQPLTALFVPRERLLLRWQFFHHDKTTIERSYIAELKSILSRWTLGTGSAHEPVAVVIGHRNFAHHLWNELPALERLLKIVRPENLPELFISREPLGPLAGIYPELAQWKITRMNSRMRSSVNDSGRLLVKPGSYRISSAVVARIRRYAENAATDPTRKLIAGLRLLSAPTFWISVRTQSPTMTNQVDTLTRLATRLLGEFERCAILFDGFSPPHDWLQCDADLREFYTSSVESSIKEIDTIIHKVREDSPPNSQQLLVNAGGFGILDSIALAQTATCYVCHIGTVQHKIAWTANKKGIIHAKRRKIIDKSEVWHHPGWLEEGVLPIPVPDELVRRSDGGENYAVSDPYKFAEFVVHHFKSWAGAVSLPPTPV